MLLKPMPMKTYSIPFFIDSSPLSSPPPLKALLKNRKMNMCRLLHNIALASLGLFCCSQVRAAEPATPENPVPKKRPANAASAPANEKPVADTVDARREQVMKGMLSRPSKNDRDLVGTACFPLAAYWMNERLPEADAAVIRMASPELPGVRLKRDEEANTDSLYLMHSYLLQRIYFLFNSRSEYFPGRMSKAAEDAVAAATWKLFSTKTTKEMARPEALWWNGGSENLIGRNRVSHWGAAQILASHPDYRDRKYADGTPVQEMAKAFDDYHKEFARQRASRGVMVEVASGYNGLQLNALYNIADFSPDPMTRQRTKMFLDLYLADYAIEQIDGLRGGSRHRCYPGLPSLVGGGSGSDLAGFFFGVGEPTKNLSIRNFGLMSTSYRPSPLVESLVRAGAARGTYEYVSRRLGKGATPEQVGKPVEQEKVQDSTSSTEEDSDETPAGGKVAPPAGSSTAGNQVDSGKAAADGKAPKPGLASHRGEDAEALKLLAKCMDPNGGNLLRYTYCTPDFVMGTSMVPALPLSEWTPISAQNRWEGVIFAGNTTARIFPQAEGAHSYNTSWSVQSKGVMIEQRLKLSMIAKGQSIWFDGSLKREERDGWVFAEAPRAYAAVRVLAGGTRWEPSDLTIRNKPLEGMWLRCEDEYSPVIIDVARKSDYPDFAAFQKAILANTLTWKNNRLDYHSDLYKTQLTLFADYSKPPEINGTPINYSPAKCYDSPFIQGDWGTGVVTIRYGKDEQVLDFNK